MQKPIVRCRKMMRSEEGGRKGDLPKWTETHRFDSLVLYSINTGLSYNLLLYGGLSHASERCHSDAAAMPSLLFFCVIHVDYHSKPRFALVG